MLSRRRGDAILEALIKNTARVRHPRLESTFNVPVGSSCGGEQNLVKPPDHCATLV
jgi:hypothetical protein